jgi:hypothetical protein
LIPAVANCLDDAESSVRERAADLLGTLGRDAPEAAARVLSASHELTKRISARVHELTADCTMQHWLDREASTPLPDGSTKHLIEDIFRRFDSKKYDDRDAVSAALIVLASRAAERDVIEPALVRLLRHNDQWVRVRAIRALWTVTHESDVVMPFLSDELKCRPAGLLVLDCIGEMGESAVALVPTLRRMVEQDERLPEGGFADQWISQDEQFVEAINEVLSRISENV